MGRRTPAPIVAADSAEAAVRGADLIVLVTSSPTPVIEDAWVSKGAHVVCVGACRPNQQEMPPALVARSRLYVDSKAAAIVESGDVVMNIAAKLFDESHIRGEIGELVLGRIEGRRSADEITVFKSLGMAVEDVVAADLVFRRASEIRSRNGADAMTSHTPPPKKRSWVPIVLGVLLLFGVLGVGCIVVAVSYFRQNMSVTGTSETAAMQQLDEVRKRFPGQQPLIQLVDGTPQLVSERASQTPTANHLDHAARDRVRSRRGQPRESVVAVLVAADEIRADSNQCVSARLGRPRRVVPRRRHRKARARHNCRPNASQRGPRNHLGRIDLKGSRSGASASGSSASFRGRRRRRRSPSHLQGPPGACS